MRSPRHSPRCGFTLLEVVISVSMMSVLMIGIGSALVIASRSLPSDDNPLNAQVDAAQAVDMLMGDLMCTQSVPERAGNLICVVVEDRDGDTFPEKLRYYWSGTEGDPLVRSINGASDETLVKGVKAFELTYETRKETSETPGGPNESAETLLFTNDGSNNQKDGTVTSSSWFGQYFKPTLPGDAQSWSVTRAKIQLRRESSNPGTTTVGLRLPDGALKPSATVIDSATVEQTSLSTAWTWIERSFSADGLNPATGLCLTLTTTDADSCRVRYQNKNVTTANAALSFGTPTWQTPITDQALLFYVYGTVTTASAPMVEEVSRIVRIRISLTLVAAPDEPMETTVQLLNLPEA